MDKETIVRNFTYHKPNEEQADTYDIIREMARNLALYYEANCPNTRERNLAFTKLEESVMWANASIAREGQ